MAVIFPSSPSINDEFFAGGKAFKWDGYSWKRFKSAIIDGGFAITQINQNDDQRIVDGGSA